MCVLASITPLASSPILRSGYAGLRTVSQLGFPRPSVSQVARVPHVGFGTMSRMAWILCSKSIATSRSTPIRVANSGMSRP